jgi:methylmalonyl-CoA carboxyltransferase large subunit
MVRITNTHLAELIDDLRKQISALTERVAQLETAPVAAPAPAPVPEPVQIAAPAPTAPAPPEISEEELIAISAALAAYLGVRVHIRQIRLIGSRAWAQEGRVSIQASHRLHSQ